MLKIVRGYLEATKEIEQQVQASNDKFKFDDIVATCGWCFSTLPIEFSPKYFLFFPTSFVLVFDMLECLDLSMKA